MCIYYGQTPEAYQHLSPLKRRAKCLVEDKSIFYNPLLRGDRLAGLIRGVFILRDSRLAGLIRGVFFKRGED